MAEGKRAPWFIYGPVWLKQWFVESTLWLWDFAGRYSFLYLFFVMFGFFCLLWVEEGFWVGLIGGNIIGLVVAILFALAGFVVLVCLCFLSEIVCAPFYFVARCFGWELPECPRRLAGMAEDLEMRRRFEQIPVENFEPDGHEPELQRLKSQNSLLKLGLMLFGIDLFFNHFGDDE